MSKLQRKEKFYAVAAGRSEAYRWSTGEARQQSLLESHDVTVFVVYLGNVPIIDTREQGPRTWHRGCVVMMPEQTSQSSTERKHLIFLKNRIQEPKGRAWLSGAVLACRQRPGQPREIVSLLAAKRPSKQPHCYRRDLGFHVIVVGLSLFGLLLGLGSLLVLGALLGRRNELTLSLVEATLGGSLLGERLDAHGADGRGRSL